MKSSILTLFLILNLIDFKSKAQTSTYKIITELAQTWSGIIDTNEIKKLDEPLKALAAFYSCIGGQ
jgi:hypothetical protein